MNESFEGDSGRWTWSLPPYSASTLLREPVFVTKGGAGPVYRGKSFNASSVDRVRMTISVSDMDSSTPTKVQSIAFRWARIEDLDGTKWPFSDERAVTFEKDATATGQDVWVAELKKHSLWNGIIKGASIGFRLAGFDGSTQATESMQSVKIHLKGIEFLQLRFVPAEKTEEGEKKTD